MKGRSFGVRNPYCGCQRKGQPNRLPFFSGGVVGQPDSHLAAYHKAKGLSTGEGEEEGGKTELPLG